MRKYIFGIALSLCLFLSISKGSPTPEPKNNCIQCHEFIGGEMGNPVSQWFGSTHQIQGITCDQCHGGNPDIAVGDLRRLSSQQVRALSKRAMYQVPTFVGAPTGQAQFDLCATCHPESTEDYAASIMGQAYLLKTGGPSCTKCHGAHRNVIPSVPQSCKGCHQDTTGFDRLPAMKITEVQVRELPRIRIQIAEEKVTGDKFLFRHHLKSFQTALITWSLVLVLFLVAVGLYRVVERRNK